MPAVRPATLTIPIADDSATVWALTRSHVAPVAGRIHECADGEAAVAAYVAHRPDVVLMDIAMPGLDGIIATRHLRTLGPAARIVIGTNHDQPDLRDAAHAAGACAFVAKSSPVELHAILAGMSG